jgi:hypothetical protein
LIDQRKPVYALYRPAATIAYEVSRAEDDAEFKMNAAELRKGRDGCHAAYLKIDP